MDGVELIVRDYGMSISKSGPKVTRFQIRVVREDSLRSFPLSKQTKNKFDGDAHVSNDRFATKNLGVQCYSSNEVSRGSRFLFYVTVAASALWRDSDKD